MRASISKATELLGHWSESLFRESENLKEHGGQEGARVGNFQRTILLKCKDEAEDGGLLGLDFRQTNGGI